MTDAWVVVALTGVGTIALKAAGPMLLGHRSLPAPVMRVLDLLAPALLAALVVVLVFGEEQRLVLDHRVIGLAAALGAAALRAPMAVIVVAAAVATALARLLF
jgi:branched-subunit amino acid transport protein